METNLSQPIVLQVENISGKKLENIELFDALERAWHDFPNGNVETNEVKISLIATTSSKLTYQRMLRSIATGDVYTFGKVGISLIEGPDVPRVFFYIGTDSDNGNTAEQDFEVVRVSGDNPVFIYDKPFDLDKRTSLMICSLLEKQKMQIFLYPVASLDLTKQF
jgi:hypothetical protein